MAKQTSKRMRNIVSRDMMTTSRIQKKIIALFDDLNSSAGRHKKRRSYKKLKKYYKDYNHALKTLERHVLKMYRRVV